MGVMGVAKQLIDSFASNNEGLAALPCCANLFSRTFNNILVIFKQFCISILLRYQNEIKEGVRRLSKLKVHLKNTFETHCAARCSASQAKSLPHLPQIDFTSN